MSQYIRTVTDGNGDGRADISFRDVSQGGSAYLKTIYFGSSGKEILLDKVKDGFGRTTVYNYDLLTSGSGVYTPGIPASYPLTTIRGGLNVVSALLSPDGNGGTNAIHYSYTEGQSHLLGLGFLGFKKITATNATQGIKSVSYSDVKTTTLVSPSLTRYDLCKTQDETYLSTGQCILRKDYVVTLQNTLSTSFYQQVTSSTEQNLLTGASSNTNSTYDANGNITQFTVNVNNVETVTTNTSYTATGSNSVQRPSGIKETRTRGTNTSVDSVSFIYDPLGRLGCKILHANKPQFDIYTYTYGNFGNIKSESRTGTLVFQTATTNYIYDNKGRFPVSVTNPLGQIATTTWDARWGKPLVETGIDDVRNEHSYDTWGNLLTTEVKYWKTVSAYSITYTQGWDETSVTHGIFWKKVSHPGRPDSKVWYDRLGRELQTETEHANNQKVYTEKTYNSKGQLSTSSRPHLMAETPVITTYQYNDYGLLSSSSDVYGTTTNSYTYANGKTPQTVNSPKGQTTTVTDAAGRVLEQTDNGGKIVFTYDSRGQVLTVKQGPLLLVSNSYDPYGRKTSMVDCDAGTTAYTYDIWNRLKTEMDNKGNKHQFNYDVLGKVTLRYGPEGYTQYQYHSAGGGYANQLHTVTGFNGVNEEYDYDVFGRPGYSKTTIDGKTFETYRTYNNYGDLTNVSYNTGFGYQNNYDANGFLVDVRTNWSTLPPYSSETLFTAGSMNGQGQYLSYTLGNGKTTTKTYDYGFPLNTSTPGVQNLMTYFDIQTGNLGSRWDYMKNLKEDFSYDNLNRLTSSTVSTFGGTINTAYPPSLVTYDQSGTMSQGNIKTKTDVGNYKYGGFPRHAVQYVDNSPQQISKWKQDITYTPFRKAEKVTETDNLSTSNFEQTFTYDAAYDRVKSVLTQNGTMQQTRYYLGDYEYNLVGNQYIYYVPGGDGLCAIVQYCPSINAKVKEIHYTYTDHLGSIVAVTDETGSLEAEQNFDPWGRFRNPGDWSYNVSPHPAGIKAWLYRGYTGHEHMAEFSLINMNGRMYDPLLGRMLSPDIFTHEGSQGYNRFSYAHNNPMSNVDPDGNNPLVAVAIGAAIAAASYTYNVSQSAGGFSNWNWGTFSLSLVKGGIMGGFSYGIGHAFQAAGSVSTVVGNNQFLSTALKASTHGLVTYATTGETSSAYAAFFGDLAGSQSASVLGDIGGLAFSSAVGGAASWVDGGNFWEGAAFAAMGYLTNQQMHKYFPAPKEIPGHPEVGKGKYHRPSGRVRWKAPNGDIWEWDKQHGDVEVYDRQGNHKGSFNPNTNQQKPAVPGRTTPKFVAPGLIRLLQNIPRMMPTPTPSIVPFNEKLMELMIPPNYKNNNYDIQ